MKRLPIRLAVLLAFGQIALSATALAGPREVVQEIATLIENNFFDAAKASEVARELRGEAKAGKFDEFRDPRDLAVALTGRLKPIDQHFNVLWFSGSSVSREVSALDSQDRSPRVRGQSHGIRSVSVLPGGIGYIELRNFSYFSFARQDDPARLALEAALQLVADASAVIVDLRDNIGGYAAMAGYLVSAFTAPEVDIFNVVHRRDDTESERPKEHYRNPRTSVPVYVLVSGSTASAAEAAAYTLQAAKRAVIVGERTSGAANPGGMFPVREGFNVFISIGTPVNPITRTNWEGEGVHPDVVVPADQALHRAQLLALETLRTSGNGRASREVEWALEALRAETDPPPRVSLTEYAGAYGDATLTLADSGLTLRRGRRAAQVLRPLRADRFFVAGEPGQRVVFERDARGQITGFQLLRSSAYSTWFPRSR